MNALQKSNENKTSKIPLQSELAFCLKIDSLGKHWNRLNRQVVASPTIFGGFEGSPGLGPEQPDLTQQLALRGAGAELGELQRLFPINMIL